MSTPENKRKGCSKPVVLFFVFAAAIVIAFLIVGLVKTCNADHEEKELEEAIQQQDAAHNLHGTADWQIA